MSFMYPRTITVTRPAAAPIAGDGGYAGLDSTQETVVASGLPANIQAATAGGQPEARVPSDAIGRATPSRIFIPRRAAAKGTIQRRDIATDELGVRYQVVDPYWNSLGYALRATLLEA